MGVLPGALVACSPQPLLLHLLGGRRGGGGTCPEAWGWGCAAGHGPPHIPVHGSGSSVGERTELDQSIQKALEMEEPHEGRVHRESRPAAVKPVAIR